MPPIIYGNTFHLPDWGVDVCWRAAQAPPGGWAVSAAIQLPPNHPVLPAGLLEYEVWSTRTLVHGPPTGRCVEAVMRGLFVLPCGACERSCLDMARLTNKAKVARALRALLRCGLNPLIFQIELNETLDLHLLFEPEGHNLRPLLEHLEERPGLLPLVAAMLANDVQVRERFGRRLRRDIAATADYGRLGKDRPRSFVSFCQTRMRYLVHDTRRFFLARKMGATFFLTHYITARAHRLLVSGEPPSEVRTLDSVLGRARQICSCASLEICEAFHAPLLHAKDFQRRNWVCRHCLPGQAGLGENDVPMVSRIGEELHDEERHTSAERGQLRRTSMRHSHHRVCMTDADGEPLAGFVHSYFLGRGLDRQQVFDALAWICSRRRLKDGAPCQLTRGFTPDVDVQRAVAEFVVQVLSRLRRQAGDEPVHRILSCIYAEARRTICSKHKKCKVFIFRDIQFSRLGPPLLDRVRRCFLLPEDLLWYFWYRWAKDSSRELRTGTSFVGDCKRELDALLRRGLLGKEHADTLKAQLFSYFPDEFGPVPVWHLRQAMPGLEEVLGQKVDGMPGPWRELTRAQCWKLLMKHEQGPQVPQKGVTSFDELMRYQPHQVWLDELADMGILLADEQKNDEDDGWEAEPDDPEDIVDD